MLERVFKIKVDIANNGNEALALLKDQVTTGEALYKLIIIDYKMPGIDGIEAAK